MIRVEFTVAELDLLTTLASDQLFRIEFIDPKMPGYKADNDKIGVTKTLIARLRSVLAENRSVGSALSVDLLNAPARVVNRAAPFNNHTSKV